MNNKNKVALWVDDLHTAPYGFKWIKTVDETISYIKEHADEIEMISLDHDSGEFVKHGGDYIEILNWLEEVGLSYPIHIHSMNPVGRDNMKAIIQRNGWTELRTI